MVCPNVIKHVGEQRSGLVERECIFGDDFVGEVKRPLGLKEVGGEYCRRQDEGCNRETHEEQTA